jgi:hypothetical protein
MEAKKFTIQNQAREITVSTGVTAINSTLEPLAALRVMVEGLESDNETGLWLTHVTVIPMVPRISPFDLVYLDKDYRVVERVELLPASEIPRFKKPAASALVLPFRTISSAKIETGNQFSFQEIAESETQESVETQAEENAREVPALHEEQVLVAERGGGSNPGMKAPERSSLLDSTEIMSFPATHPVPAQVPAPHDEDTESTEEIRSPIAEVVTPIFGSWFRHEREADRQRQQQPELSPQPQSGPIEAAESNTIEAVSATVQFPNGPREIEHWTKATANSDVRISSIPSPAIPEISRALAIEKTQVPPAPPQAIQGISVPPPANDRSIHLEPGRPRRDKAQVEPDLQEKKPLANRFLRWLYPALYDQNRRGSERRPSPGLVAYEFSGDTPRMHEVENISSTGIYLRTNGRWEPGARVSLILQRSGPLEENLQQRVEFETGAVRAGGDGVGLTFVLPEGMDLQLWESPERNGIYEAQPDGVVRELRMARALAFLRRICPPAGEEIKEMLHKSLSSVRVSNIVEIAFKTERLLAHEPNACMMFAHPDLTVRILEHGSWVDVEWIQELWAGLLATSCTFEGQDESNLVFINLLSRMAPLPTQILTAACAKATQAMAESGSVSPYLLAFSAEEMAKITRSNNLTKIYRSITELSELGLLEKGPRLSSQVDPEAAKARPTHLGLQMYARCNGQRGAA